MFIVEHWLPRQFEMMALQEVSLSESWVWARAVEQGQKANKADMVEYLSLQGSYAKKIVSLEDAFKTFKNLQSLDLSRNLLTSLQGIEYLQSLRLLNLYYNNVESLFEVSRLKSLPALKELDLRLNPVTRNEVNYRFFVVHLLESLETLDDRIVRESEKKTAQQHFGLMKKEENMLSKDSKKDKMTETNILDVNLSAKLNLDTTLILDSIMSSAMESNKQWMSQMTQQRTEMKDPLKKSSMSSPTQLPGEKKGTPQAVQGQINQENEYRPLLSPSRSSLRCPGKLSLGRSKEGCRVTFAECSSLESSLEKGITSEGSNDISLTRTVYFNEKDKTLLPKTCISTSTPLKKETVQNSDDDRRSQKDCSTKLIDNLKPPLKSYYDETIKQQSGDQSSKEKLSKLSSDLCTTTQLNSDPLLSALVSDLNSLKSMQKYFSSDNLPEKSLSPFITATTFLPSNKDKELSSKRCLTPEKTMTLPYEPLFSSPKAETEQATRISIPMLSKLQPINKERETVLQKLLELVDRYWKGSGSLLNNQLFLAPARELLSSLIVSAPSTSMNGYGLEIPSVTSQRGYKHEDVESLMRKLEMLSEENCCLVYKIQQMEEVAASNSPVTGNQTQSPDELRHKNEQLRLQVEYLNQQLKQYKKLQDTMSLLQDSQRCLVSTNDFLLHQLSKDSYQSSITHPLSISQLTTEEKKNSKRHHLSEISDSSSSNNLDVSGKEKK
uniref:Leucine-rich repeat-containing protein 36 isoform X1 n=1 Tax=Geotrypetes seraphini TaxID=260995 RepID=A0A6P8QJN0_GEOSA|nr:leucine-rich repeat-containing protein 36 isoform X1 [Geotrypetes seraphini]